MIPPKPKNHPKVTTIKNLRRFATPTLFVMLHFNHTEIIGCSVEPAHLHNVLFALRPSVLFVINVV